MLSTYTWSAGTEQILRFGPAGAPVVVAAMPLFEEANRTRAFVVAVLRALADHGIAGALPDLPGMGDSLVPTECAALGDWRAAFAAEVVSLQRPVHVFGIRGGTLLDLDADVESRYHLAPVAGAGLVRDLMRTRLAVATEGGDVLPPGPPIELAGNNLDRQLLVDLGMAAPVATGRRRVARLQSDAQPCDVRFDAAPLWRRAEPGNDIALAGLVADDIAQWIAACAA